MTIIPTYADINFLGLAAFAVLLWVELWHRIKLFLPVQIMVGMAAGIIGGYGVGGHEYLLPLGISFLMLAIIIHLLNEVWRVLPKEKARR